MKTPMPIVVLLLAVCAYTAAADWSGPIDFPIDTKWVQVQGPPNVVMKQIVVVGMAGNPERPLSDFVRDVRQAIAGAGSTQAAFQAVKALQDPANPPSNTKVFDAADVDRRILKRAYVYDAGNHPIWLRVRVEADSSNTGSAGPVVDQWYRGSGEQSTRQRLQTYFVTRLTIEVPVMTEMGRDFKAVTTTETKHFIREWIDP